MTLTSKAFVLLVLCACLVGCGGDGRPSARGKLGNVVVVTAGDDWDGAVGQAIRNVLEHTIDTLPVPEPSFTVEHLKLGISKSIDKSLESRRLIVFVGALGDSTNVSRTIASALSEDVLNAIRAGEQSILQVEDVWYRNQLVVFATAETAQDLAGELTDQGETLRYVLNEATRKMATNDMFRQLEQQDIEDRMTESHDFSVRVQHDFFVSHDTTLTVNSHTGQFFRIRRVLTDTWRDLHVFYLPDASPDLIQPEWIYQMRDSLGSQVIRGTYENSFVKIDYRRPLISEQINFLDRFAYETRGLWMMTEDAMGGPFVNYTFYDETQRRIYMIDGMVFAPNFNKREFLRQMEVIAHTFKTTTPNLASE